MNPRIPRRGRTLMGAGSTRARFVVVGAAVALMAAVVAAGCSGGGEGGDEGSVATATTAPPIDPGDHGRYRPEVDPADFVTGVGNPYLPLGPGSRWVYEGESGGRATRHQVVVTDQTREVMGVSTTVVRDTVRVDGEVVEDTRDYYAQDRDGAVWYFGEDTKEYEHGEVVSTDGSWEAGVDGALPGIAMPARPMVGDAYREEYLKGTAEDMAEILRTYATLAVPFGAFGQVVETENWSPLEPEVIEHKSYAPGVGLVQAETVKGGDEVERLVSHAPPT